MSEINKAVYHMVLAYNQIQQTIKMQFLMQHLEKEKGQKHLKLTTNLELNFHIFSVVDGLVLLRDRIISYHRINTLKPAFLTMMDGVVEQMSIFLFSIQR